MGVLFFFLTFSFFSCVRVLVRRQRHGIEAPHSLFLLCHAGVLVDVCCLSVCRVLVRVRVDEALPERAYLVVSLPSQR